jgi:hypothetical protein
MEHQPNDSLSAELERPPELPMDEHHLVVEEGALKLTGRIKHCGRSAYRHLRLAWKLRPIDSEMSLFRAITAEEEAAAALILALQRQRYPGANKLDHKKHDQKLAIIPFLDAIQTMLFDAGVKAPTVQISLGKRPQLSLAIEIKNNLENEEPLFGWPDHPLNFVLRHGVGQSAETYLFEKELQSVADGRGLENMIAVVRDVANIRNRILYADDGGYPTVTFRDELIIERRRRVTVIMALTIAILQTPSHQLFAVQCLEAFLRVLRKLTGDGFNFHEATETEGPFLHIEELPDKTQMMKRGYRKRATYRATFSEEWPPIIRVTIDTNP